MVKQPDHVLGGPCAGPPSTNVAREAGYASPLELPRAKVLFVQPSLDPPGGSNGVAAWMLEVLAARAQVTLFTLLPFRAAETDAYYGTKLASYPIENLVYAGGALKLLRKLPLKLGLVELHLLMRGARQAAAGPYDFVCSANNEQDLGRPGLDYIHYPWNHHPRPDAPRAVNESLVLRRLLKVYYWMCGGISGFRKSALRDNLLLVNSAWTGGVLRQAYPGVKTVVLHPPALCSHIQDDRSRRAPRFLSIGRVFPTKEWIKLIDIVHGLRARGHDVGLTLAGSRDSQAYEAAVREKILEVGPWVELRTDFTRSELEELMQTHAYGLHGMVDEHYGMAVAELLLGGCLTMVPRDGGQMEIVTDSRLQYSSVDDAIEKWHAILSQPVLQVELLQAQRAHCSHLGVERFCREFDEILDRYFSKA